MLSRLRTPFAPGAIVLTLIACNAAAAPDPPKKIGRAVMTFYWTVEESSWRYRLRKASSELRDPAGHVIARTSRRFKLDLVRQGTGVLRDGRTVVYVRSVAGESRFRVTRSKYGLSTSGCPLVPYRTVAVDPHFVKPGTRVYIPKLEGARLPDGTVHDGMFIATDRGHFRGAHVDVFTGLGPHSARAFARKARGMRARVPVYVAGRSSGCRP